MIDVIVTGGRDYSDAETLNRALSLFDIGLLIQGGARGADALAKEYAKRHDIECVEFPANWAEHGRSAGPIRNGQMCNTHPNAVVIAFPGGVGTMNCKSLAQARKMLVIEVLK